MEQEKIIKEIIKIQDDLDIGAKGMGKAMNISPQTFRNKKNPKVKDHSFNEKNLIELKNYLKKYCKKL